MIETPTRLVRGTRRRTEGAGRKPGPPFGGSRRPGRFGAALATAVAMAIPVAAFGHGGSTGTFDDIAEAVFEGQSCATAGCHLPPRNAGGLNLEESSAWAELLGFGFGEQPTNTAAQQALKMRVDPGRPWNSYLIDKLRGHLLEGEGDPMPQLQGDWQPIDECIVRDIENWILQGAPREGWVPGDENHSFDENGCNVDTDPSCVVDPCATSQPEIEAPEAPDEADGVQLVVASPEGQPFTGRDALFETTVSGIHPGGSVTRIEVTARPGLAWATLARSGDDAPLFVAVFDPTSESAQVETLELPAGYGIAVAEDQEWVVRMAIRPDAFDPHDPVARAGAWVNLAISSDDALAPLEPFADDFGTQALFVPARFVGATGGVWPATEGARVAALRLWTDVRAIRGGVQNGTETVVALDGTGSAPYVVPAEPIAVDTGLAYYCQHDGTHLVRKPRLGCAAPTTTAAGIPIPPPGQPAALGAEGPAPLCRTTSDCTDGTTCAPVNLVGGEGVEDARCTLVGLRAD